jgi:hypothetical protein
VDFPKPNKNELRSFAKQLAVRCSTPLSSSLTAHIAGAKSYADAEKQIQGELRRRALREL